MLNDFSTEYSERTDDELLHLASQRHFLTTEARTALDAELSRRNLTESDRIEHQRFVKRQERREAIKHRRKPFGPFKYQLSWRDILWAFAAMALISFSYLALPSRYHMKSDWQDAAFIVMMTAVLIAIASRSVFWRNFAFWISLVMSSAIHLVLVHSWTRRVGDLSRSQGRGAALFGFVLFLAIYGFARLLQRMFHSEEDQTTHRGEGHVLE
jgi:hypothetical protein